MTTYNIPEEPAGPVWDKEGHRWSRLNDGSWLREGATWTFSAWYRLLQQFGPITDTPPVKVGDKVTLSEFSKMPDCSIAGALRDVYINYYGLVFTDAQVCKVDLYEIGDDEVTVLRVGREL